MVQVGPDGKYVVDVDDKIDISKCTANTRVALRNDSYTLHTILPTKVDPLVSLMKVEKVPDSTYVLCFPKPCPACACAWLTRAHGTEQIRCCGWT